MAGFEGELTIQVSRQGDAISEVRIDSSRPLQAARIFRGKSVEQTLKTLPLLYSVCGTAQAQAAVTALEQAQGLHPDPPVNTAREMLVWLETAREHLWRIMIDWPAFLQEDTAKQRLAPLMRLLPETRAALFADGEAFLSGSTLSPELKLVEMQIETLETALQREVFGCSSEQWLSMTASSAIGAWIDNGGTAAARLLRRLWENSWSAMGSTKVAPLPLLDEQLLLHRFAAADAAEFIARPTWQDQGYETTPLARQYQQPLITGLLDRQGNGLMTRLLARMVELAQIPAVLKNHLGTLGEAAGRVVRREQRASEGEGLAQVEAARGRLIHRVEVRRGIVHDYQIIAPTEWNFQPDGVLAQGFMSMHAADTNDLQWLCKLLVNAIDPCVGYRLRLD